MAKRSRKGWKVLFFSLLGLNAFILALFIILIFVPSNEDPEIPRGENGNEAGAEFTINTRKETLNELINAYIDQLLGDESNKYSVRLEEDVQLYGSIEAFRTEIPITIRLEPIVQENGDLVLRQKDISLGLLYLPNNKVLEYVEKSLDIPEWIQVNPDEETIYVAITEMELQSNLIVSVQDFDLEEDDLSFGIKVPYETIGLQE